MNDSTEQNPISTSVLGVLLAGGRSLRMNGRDKRFLEDGTSNLLEHTIARASPQVSQLIICTHNDNPEVGNADLPIVKDISHQRIGPAAALQSAYRWLQNSPERFDWLMTFACDTPGFPENLVQLLLRHVQGRDVGAIVPVANGQAHHAFALWSVEKLAAAVDGIAGGQYRLLSLLEAQSFAAVELDVSEEAFFNINTPDDWQNYLARQLFP